MTMKGYQHILVAIDGSHSAEKAFQEALFLAELHHAHLYIACIVNDVEIAYSLYNYATMLADEKENVEKEVLKKLYDAKEYGVEKMTGIVELGNPKVYLAKTIPEQYPIDLIVVGASGKGGIQKWTVGSTTDYIVKHAPVNVLVVK
ncbi:universal stress protein [Vagococcus lutrae]|nr:universal stress protein [Vagococcus lutrae]